MAHHNDAPEGVSPAAQRKRDERERKRSAGFKNKAVTLSPRYQEMVEEILDYTGLPDFQALTVALIKAYHVKVTAHKQRHQCCGKCGAPYKPGGACVFSGDYQCQYAPTGQRTKELKP